MAKCKWENGHYVPCGNHQGITKFFSLPLGNISKSLKILGVNYCPICGADIREPKPEVVIKSSGKTQVAWFNGNNYLLTGKEYLHKLNRNPILEHPEDWQQFPIKITDEIAKLRPLVICKSDEAPEMLVYICKSDIAYTVTNDIEYKEPVVKYRLATVDDLEE